MGLKDAKEFARYLSMGVRAAEAVAIDLHDSHGHRPIELERYALSNKIWGQKVKRLRMPDLLCIGCGLRIESRGKSALRIELSHSATPGREWFGGGMRPTDVFAFGFVSVTGPAPVLGRPLYLTTEALRRAVGAAKTGLPKAAAAGSESSITWPSYVPSTGGTLDFKADDTNPTHFERPLRIVRKKGSTNYTNWKKWNTRYLYLTDGATIDDGRTFVAGVVEPLADLACHGKWDLNQELTTSKDPIDVFAAVKAAGYLDRQDLVGEIERIGQTGEWRIQLEAWGSLARLGHDQFVDSLLGRILNTQAATDERLEAVLILSEINSQVATKSLAEIARTASVDSEIRSASVWGLGHGSRPDSAAVIDFIGDDDSEVAIHAVASVVSVDDRIAKRLLGLLAGGSQREAESAAEVLLQHDRVDELLEAARGDAPGRPLALRALGDLPPARLGVAAETEFRELLEPMWRSQDDWIRSIGSRRLEDLSGQTMRVGPAF
jgi:hypothetical protein